jgi:hypothetical protein
MKSSWLILLALLIIIPILNARSHWIPCQGHRGRQSCHGKDIIDDLPSYFWSSIIDVIIDNEKIFACPSSGGL